MPLLNLTVLGAHRTHIPLTVVQVEPDMTFATLFSKILAGAHCHLIVDGKLSGSSLDKVYVHQTKDGLSAVDEQLVIDDVCTVFGQHVKYIVTLSVREDAQSPCSSTTLQNAFIVLMGSQRAIDMVKLPPKIQEKNIKDKLFNDLVSFFESKRWKWSTGGQSHGQKFIAQFQECLWYIDGHHQTFADRCHPIPSLFEGFTGYNTPELSKHRKRSHTNLNADTLKLHAGNLKEFLLCPWMKKQECATIRTATEGLAEALESYVFELIEKKRSVQTRNETPMEVASDDLAFTTVNVKDDHPIILNGIVDELQKKGNYEPVFVCDFASVDRRQRYMYIKQLEKGLPMRCVMHGH